MFLIFILLLIYFIFCIWLTNGQLKSQNQTAENTIDIFVSVIVAVKNEEKNIVNLLDSLSNQTFKSDKYEIIIANDNSNDKTEEMILNFKNKIPNLKYVNVDQIPDGWSSKKWALNSAILKSQGTIILQTDGDCIPNKKWIEKMSAPFLSGDVGFVSGHTPLIYSEKSLFNRLLVFENIAQDAFNASCSGNNMIISCVGRSIAFRKDFFEHAMGYDDIQSVISGDDDLLLHKIVHFNKCKISYVSNKDSHVFSYAPSSLDEFVNQRMRFASKGLLYYNLPFISYELKLILPLLYIINLAVVITLCIFISTSSIIYLMPYLIKLISDFLIVSTFCNQINFKWDTGSFLILSLLHPFYIIFFSTLAPFKRVKWK